MSRLFKNVAYNVTGQGLVLLLGFVGVKFIFNRLGPDAFGVIYFNQVLVGVLTTALELGVLATMIREVSAHYTTERQYIERLIRTASLFYWSIGLILLVAVFVGAPLLVDRWINLKSIDRNTAAWMLRFLSITGLITLPRALYSSLFQGRQRMELNNGIDVGSSAVQQLGVIITLATGGGAFAVVQWIAISAVLSTITYMAIVGHMFGVRVLVPGYFPDAVRRNFNFTAHMGALSVLNMVLLQFDKVVVSKLLPIASVGYYAFASTVIVRVSFAANAIAQAALPSFSDLHARRDADRLNMQYRQLQDLVAYGMVIPFAAVTFAAMPLYTFLFNRQVAATLLLPTAFLCLGFFMGATINVPYTFSIAVGKPQIAARSNALALFVVIPVTTGLTYFFGLSGAALSWVVYYLFVYAYMIPRICRQCLEIPALSWYSHIGKVFALSLATYGSMWLLIVVPSSHPAAALAFAYAAGSIAFLVGALLMIGPELRATVMRLLARISSRQVDAVP